MTDPALQALLDKLQIAELLTRYLRSVDRGDVATLRACYLPGATEDHGGLFAGPAQDYVDSVAAALTHPRARPSHNMTNLLIEHWMRGLLAPDPSVLRMSGKFPSDPVYAPR